MDRILKIGDVLIKASATKDKKGRAGYFIGDSDTRNNKYAAVVVRKRRSAKSNDSKMHPEVEQSLKEMGDYKDGKVKLRSIDEYLKTI